MKTIDYPKEPNSKLPKASEMSSQLPCPKLQKCAIFREEHYMQVKMPQCSDANNHSCMLLSWCHISSSQYFAHTATRIRHGFQQIQVQWDYPTFSVGGMLDKRVPEKNKTENTWEWSLLYNNDIFCAIADCSLLFVRSQPFTHRFQDFFGRPMQSHDLAKHIRFVIE